MEIYKLAAIENKTVSNYLRDHLTIFNSETFFDKEVSHFQNREFIITTEFLQLIVWMYTKRKDKKCISSNDQFDAYIETIKSISGNLPKDLVIEFDKVLFDILSVKNENPEKIRTFIFNKKSEVLAGFNYEKLEQYIINLASNNKVVMHV